MDETIKIINITNAEHYNWGEQCDGWHLVKSGELSIINEKMPAGTTEVKHYHKKSRQFFYILSGKACMEVQDKKFVLNPSEGIEIPPLTPHRIYNESNGDVEFLVISQPESHGDRIIV
jgi:mannose-6-phosphate isomerase-like protein (cupin superfamily)